MGNTSILFLLIGINVLTPNFYVVGKFKNIIDLYDNTIMFNKLPSKNILDTL